MRSVATAFVSLLVAATLPAVALAQHPEPVGDDALAPGAESPELASLRLAESEIFQSERPLVEIAPAVAPEGGEDEEGEDDAAWTEGLNLPDLPVRWDHRVVTFVNFFRSDPRGRSIMTSWLRREPRYSAMVQAELRALELPSDLIYVAMIESGFDPRARSSAGAVGMWQFMGGTGDEYGLRRDHWIDQRMSPDHATRAAARYLRDLYQRFGSWELALAAYNMGYNALLRSIRKYNTNDFWVLSRLDDALPFETTVYVAKIMAAAIIAKNASRFGFGDVTRDPAIIATAVDVPGGTSIEAIARAAGVAPADIANANPELLRSRTPAGDTRSHVRIPSSSLAAFQRAWPRAEARRAAQRPYRLRFGETLADVAESFGTTEAALRRLNELPERGAVASEFTLLVPNTDATRPPRNRPVVTVPATRFQHPGRSRVFYRVIDGDSCRAIARFFGVSLDDVRRWNGIDPNAAVHRGMVLQLFVPNAFDLTRAVTLAESEVRILTVGSPEFYEHHETERGRVRSMYRVREGDTLESIARRFELSTTALTRINRMTERTSLAAGREIVVFASRGVDVNAQPQRRARSTSATATPASTDTAAATAPATTPEAPPTSVETPAEGDAQAPSSVAPNSATAPTESPVN